MVTFTTKAGLSDVDRDFITEKTQVIAPLPTKSGNGSFVHDGNVIAYKMIDTRTGRDWKCPFCTCNNSTTVKRCTRCGAHDAKFGKLDFAYKTPTKKLLDSGGIHALREVVRAEQGSKS